MLLLSQRGQGVTPSGLFGFALQLPSFAFSKGSAAFSCTSLSLLGTKQSSSALHWCPADMPLADRLRVSDSPLEASRMSGCCTIDQRTTFALVPVHFNSNTRASALVFRRQQLRRKLAETGTSTGVYTSSFVLDATFSSVGACITLGFAHFVNASETRI